MREGLVDYLVPSSPDRYFRFDIPLEEFIRAAKGTKCRVTASPDSWKASPAMYRAGMANYYAMGQKDTYLFNFFTARAEQRQYYPFRDEDYALLRDLSGQSGRWLASNELVERLEIEMHDTRAAIGAVAATFDARFVAHDSGGFAQGDRHQQTP